MEALLILGVILFVVVLTTSLSNRKVVGYLSKTNKPFIEHDDEGYLTEESYRSHIRLYSDGSIEVDTWALSQTRQFKKDMEACEKLRKFIESNKS